MPLYLVLYLAVIFRHLCLTVFAWRRVMLHIFNLKQLLGVSCILWCYYPKCYSIILYILWHRQSLQWRQIQALCVPEDLPIPSSSSFPANTLLFFRTLKLFWIVIQSLKLIISINKNKNPKLIFKIIFKRKIIKY